MSLQAVRTPEEIVAQMDARIAEMEALANTPAMRMPCTNCRWGDSFSAAWCHNPLVKGFGDKVHIGMRQELQARAAPLCGPERALWEPETSWQAFRRWSSDHWWVYLLAGCATIIVAPLAILSGPA